MAITPYPEVDALLAQLREGVRAILGGRVLGMYLYGSLALGDFDPEMSDVDFLVALDYDVTPGHFEQLGQMHRGIFTSGMPLTTELEGSYIPRAALRRYTATDVMHPHIDRGGGELKVERHDTDWVLRYWMVREHGIVLAGPPPQTLIDPISARDLKQAIVDMMWWWESQVAGRTEVQHDGYQWYAVQTMCRIRYTTETGQIVSKPAASRWALTHLDPKWHGLIRHALVQRQPPRMGRLEETLGLIRETLEAVDERARAEGLR